MTLTRKATGARPAAKTVGRPTDWRKRFAANKGPKVVVIESDFAGIKALRDAVVAEDAAIARFFETSGIQPMHVVYERFVRDYENTTRAMLAHIGVEPPPDLVIGQPRTVRLADDTTEEWIARFTADERG